MNIIDKILKQLGTKNAEIKVNLDPDGKFVVGLYINDCPISSITSCETVEEGLLGLCNQLAYREVRNLIDKIIRA